MPNSLTDSGMTTREYRFYGDDLDSLHMVAERLMERMREMPELEWVHTDYLQPFPIINVELDPVASAQLVDTTTKPPAHPGIAPSRHANATSATGFPCSFLNKRPDDEMFIDSTTAISTNTNSVMDTDSRNASQSI